MAVIIVLYFTIALIGGIFLFRFFFKREMDFDKKSEHHAGMNSFNRKAINQYKKRLSSNSKDSTALEGLAKIYFQEKDYAKALTYYKALASLIGTANTKISPFEVYLRSGICATEQGIYDEAKEYLLMAQCIDPTPFELTYYLGVCFYFLKNFEAAFKHLKVASVADPENLNALKYLGFIFFKAQNYKNALMCLNIVQQSKIKTPESTYYFGCSLIKIGKKGNAYSVLLSLSDDQVWGPMALKECTEISYKSGEYEQAIESGQEALKKSATLTPRDKGNIYYMLGNAYSQLRNYPEALQAYKEAKNLSTAYGDINDKIEFIQEIFYNKNLHTFLKGNWNEFETQAVKLMKVIFPKAKISSYQKVSSSSEMSIDILANIETRSWEDVVIFRFIRDKTQVGELLIRDFAVKLKECKAGRGICLTAGTFSSAARMYVEARLIDLIDKNKLIQYLQKTK